MIMVSSELHKLETEQQNLASADLDSKSALEVATIINAEDQKVAQAVARALPQVAKVIDMVAEAIGSGGRLIYVGAGTSGRVGALDASECSPTFDVPLRTVQYVMAGGRKALATPVEANEDSRALGQRDLAKKKPSKKDVVIGIAASGRTPYTLAALEYAKKHGARTAAVVCNPNSPLEQVADVTVVAEVGAEVLAGSTRMKAGTAEKLVLNMISTGAMAKLGYVYGNLMVNLHLKNKKLIERGIAILQKAVGVDRARAESALKAAGKSVPVALVMLKAGVSRAEAVRRLQATRGHVRAAIEIA